jgi:hypothetical protein
MVSSNIQPHLVFYLPWEHSDPEQRNGQVPRESPKIKQTTESELELTESRCSQPPVFESIVAPKTKTAKSCLALMGKSFSNLPSTIRGQRKIVKSAMAQPFLAPEHRKALDHLSKSFEEIQQSKSFRGKYGYIDFERFSFLNEIPAVMAFLVMYNVGSPLFSLLSPIVGALLAYLVLIVRGTKASFTEFVNVLSKRLAWLFSIKKLFDSSLPVYTRAKVVLTAALYCFSIYQNVKSCRSFIRNYSGVAKVFDALKTTTDCISANLRRLSAIEGLPHQLTGYIQHAGTMMNPARQVLDSISSKLPLRLTSPTNIPLALRLFYKFKHCQVFGAAVSWLCGFGGLLDVYDGLARGLSAGRLGPYIPTKSFKNSIIRKCYHPTLSNSEGCVKNDIRLGTSIVLTGRNGSGKTTLAKSVAIVAIVGSQFGVAPCEKAQMPPLETIRCELNVPDTNERDSLFEAEGRRCLELINDIGAKPDAHHLCIFDELFSGTNADEALDAATGVLKHLDNNFKVRFMVTTHMHALGASLGTAVASMAMEVIKDRPTHRLVRGVTDSSGARKTLERIGFTQQQLGAQRQVSPNPPPEAIQPALVDPIRS